MAQLAMNLYFATTNKGKLKEARLILDGFNVVPLSVGEVDESSDTFEGNALLKLQVALTRVDTAIAEDSGLMIDALDGKPGVMSKRYGATDSERIDRILTEMAPRADRRARFIAVVALGLPGREPMLFKGITEGEIALSPHGEHGFGYDPIFVPTDGDGRTFAEMTIEEKNLLSHRRKALVQLEQFLQGL
jgi:XTP/dITP diphosphohydrolase